MISRLGFVGVIGLIGVSMVGSVGALSLSDVIDQVTSTEEMRTIITHDDAKSNTLQTSVHDISHQDILDSFRGKGFITREQFAYLLDLLTPNQETIRDMDRCHFGDYERAQSLLGIAAVMSLCHKDIVRGTQQSYYYNAKLTEAEAVAMIVRARFPDAYDDLREQERHTKPGQWYRPYFAKARAEDMLTNNINPMGSLHVLSPLAALKILHHNFGSLGHTLSVQPVASLLHQTTHDEKKAHIMRWIRDKQGQQIHISDDSVHVSLDPYQQSLNDEDIFVSKRCREVNNCLTKIEFDVVWEKDRSRYCGRIDYMIDSPYEKQVSEYFCLDR